jgi:LacI family transcriptional regulator
MHALKDIAFQAGVSLATVDRVVHQRPGVSAGTQTRVEAAMRELDRQAISAAMDGKRIAIDVIIEAPHRFSHAVRQAFEAELEGLRPASMRLRFHVAETFDQPNLDQLLHNIARRGTQGIVVKLPNRPSISHQISKLVGAHIPVVAFVTDLPDSGRLAYIGMDNLVAGKMAAYLISKAKPGGDVLAVVSSNEFDGETTRLAGFHAGLGVRNLHIIQGTMGRDPQTEAQVRKLLERGIQIGAVYSAGGGNQAILRALKDAGQRPHIYVAHDLDAENRDLLRAGAIDFVIHHDLRQDARSSCQHILKALRLLPPEFEVTPSAIQLATPFNIVG